MAHSHNKLSACANCGYTFPEGPPDEFCPNCGQQNQEVSLSLGHVMEEFLEGIFHFDSKVFRTAKLLLLRPGELTKRFLAGHRMPYVPPIRLYVFISFVFFFLLSLSVKPSSDRPTKELLRPSRYLEQKNDSIRKAVSQSSGLMILDGQDSISTQVFGMKFNQAELEALSEQELTHERIDSIIRAQKQEPTLLRRTALRQTIRSLNSSPDELVHKWMKNLPILMFVLMPLFALLLKGLYRRQHQYYLAHLIFSIHFHCFVFVLFILNLLLSRVGSTDWFQTALVFLPAVYFFLALRNNYGQSFLKTLSKVLLMMTTYGMVLAGTIVVSMLLSLLTL
ncbi:DUF3667 domain-containing protein [Hymenobacter lucidus]|uniref:DUF3667 domain-containing protein n=1 Tax=Hymenobacter lucidus TaxID=2880930 RepID=A0ABS8AV73_9BACT|nr:DUF3667 domain-containing protein [Hymenobacter lucidus]MCB2409291.1 DUF3667 domain-containing protein [Hymenobacter lucidus]